MQSKPEKVSCDLPAGMPATDCPRGAADTSALHLYEYAVVRYMPRVEREEFINIGLAMMCKRRRWLRVQFHLDPDRFSALRPTHTAEQLLAQTDPYTALANDTNRRSPMWEWPVEERFRWMTAEKSACLRTSAVHPGLTGDLDATFERLFAELVL